MSDHEIIDAVPWPQFARTLPLIAFTGLVGEDMTIYACLQQAVKTFDHILVFGDNPTPEALTMLSKFMHDHPAIVDRITYIDQTNIDPWPWIAFKKTIPDWKDHMFGDGHMAEGKIFLKSWSKAAAKKYNVARALFPNAMLFSLHSDVILFNDCRERFYERIASVQDPFFDSEWYCMATCVDLNTIISITSEDSVPGNIKKHPHLSQRMVYDYPGDWGLMSLYSSSCLSIGPDPMAPQAECLWPWSEITQTQKKGHDMNVPYGVHLEFWRTNRENTDFSNVSWKFVGIESIKDSDPELYAKFKDLNMQENLYFPKQLKLDSGYRSIIV